MSQVDQLKAQPMPVVLSYMLPKYNSRQASDTALVTMAIFVLN